MGAEMVMVRRSVPDQSSQSSASTGAGGAFRGVKIQVRFPGSGDGVAEMNQLSGGPEGARGAGADLRDPALRPGALLLV